MTASIKTYSTASNARRAAKQAGYTLDQVEILIVKGAYYFRVIPADEVVDQYEPTAEDLAIAYADVADPTDVAEMEVEHFHSVTEAEHAAHRGEVTNKSTTERPCKSTTERPCKRVWIIADDMLAANPMVKRKEVIAACIAAGVAFYTARTQYQQWLGVRKEMAAREASKK